MSTPGALVSKLWNYCNILRDDGLFCGDYLEQLTFLLFLKMADEQAKPLFRGLALAPACVNLPGFLARSIGQPLSSQA
jgi:type I restriction enzyme M protein